MLILSHKEGINQNQISKELDVDKAMSARAIKKLIDLEYITKKADHMDSRAYNFFLTEKAKIIIPDIRRELTKWNDIITHNLSAQQIDNMIDQLSIVLRDAKNYKYI